MLGTLTNMTLTASRRLGTSSKKMRALISRISGQGYRVLQITQELNEGGYHTRRENLFFAISVQRMSKRQVQKLIATSLILRSEVK